MSVAILFIKFPLYSDAHANCCLVTSLRFYLLMMVLNVLFHAELFRGSISWSSADTWLTSSTIALVLHFIYTIAFSRILKVLEINTTKDLKNGHKRKKYQ